MKLYSLLAIGVCGLAVSAAAQTTSSVQIFLDDLGTAGFFISSFSPASANIAPTGSGNLDPTMTFQMGKRYKYTYTDAGNHPFEIIARGSTFSSDSPQLSLAGSAPLESNAGIGWLESGSDFYFNMTGVLADTLNAGADGPGYHCNFHPSLMRGRFAFTAADSNLAWPSSTEDFENTILGTPADQAFTSWTIVAGSVPANYVSTISNSPSGHPNQVPGSTRWLTVADNDNSPAANGRTYTNSIVVPGTGGVSDYKFSFYMDIQTLGTSGPLIVSQNKNTSNNYANAAGLEVVTTGVNLLIVGVPDGGVGTAAASIRTPLYNFTDAGGFGMNGWVVAQFQLDFANSLLKGQATGSGGVVVKTAQIAGLSLQAATAKDFRMCIRGNGANNTSTISFDNISLQGTDAPPSLVTNWSSYY